MTAADPKACGCSFAEDRSCGCGTVPHPPEPKIAAGLPALADRQLAGFPEYRAAMLTAIPDEAALAGWRARSEADLGVMLLEAWAAVLDTTGFYDARIAERSYLSTAPDDISARRLTALIGYRPRPATAAKVKLAVDAAGADPVTLPKSTGFRSGAFDGEAPQVFELAAEHKIWPQRNRFALAPVRAAAFDGTLRFLKNQAPAAGAVLALWTEPQDPRDALSVALRVGSVEPDKAPDGVTYQKVVPETESSPGLSALEKAARAKIHVAVMRIPAAEFVLPDATSTATTSEKQVVCLDSIYPQVRKGQRAVAEIGAALYPVKVTGVEKVKETIDSSTDPVIKQAVTQVSFTPKLIWAEDDGFVLHIYPFSLAAPSRIAKTQIALADVTGSGDLVAPVDLGDAPAGGTTILRGTGESGAELSGSVVETGDGQARFAAGSGARAFGKLGTPVHLHGNVVEAVRGETVGDEALGSGDAGKKHQSFTLKKKPLAWVPDASLAEGRRPELTVRVGGIVWKRVDSFFGKKPEDQVYTVSLEEDGGSRIAFGDGIRGARLPSGVDNVRATYRFGAGAAKPPAGSIKSIARPAPGLLGVIGPLPATGGSDAETPDELRRSAPASALTLGRAVSLADFEAMARSYPGILNAASAWAWDTRRQRAAAKLWIIPDEGDPAADLRDYLAARAAPDLSIAVDLAGTATATTLSVTLAYAEGHDPATVRAAVTDALFDDWTGFLAPRNQVIGGALFRSALTHAVHAVSGVASVPTIRLGGAAMPHGVAAGQGNWFDLQSGTTVS